MTTTVVTGFSPAGYDLYGKRFIETFNAFAIESIGLAIYHEDEIPMRRGVCRSRWACDGIRTFQEQNKNIPERNGLVPVAGWRKKDIANGYCYRFDAVKFSWQLFYPEHAAQFLPDGDILCWFDGDVVFTNCFSASFMESNLVNHDLCYLGRQTHTELGFWAVRLNPFTRDFLRSLAEIYRSGRVFHLQEWHSAFVFDHCRQSFMGKAKNLTPNGRGNVWDRVQLDSFSKHLKGNLKGKTLDKMDKEESKFIKRMLKAGEFDE